MSLTDAVVALLEARGWPNDAADGLVRTLVRTDDLAFAMAIVVVEEAGQLVVYSIHPDGVPEDRRGAVAELVARANVVLTIGNLDIELDAGQVRFRTGLAVGSSPATTEMVERVILDNAASAVAYFPLVTAVSNGDVGPVEALASLASR